MSDLTHHEKRQLEKLFRMDSGYIWSGAYSDRTFGNFVFDSTGKRLYDKEGTYTGSGTSKANRFRAFWSVEPNHVVGRLLADLLADGLERGIVTKEEVLYQSCEQIAQRLLQGSPVPQLEEVVPPDEARGFEVLITSVRDAIEKHQPGSGLDRLHTFALKYMRMVCANHGIAVDRSKPLNSLMGEYVKKAKEKGLIDSEMTELILKSSISTLSAYHGVRNEQSLAHDNPVLNNDESLLILNHVAEVLRFVRKIETRAEVPTGTPQSSDDYDLPF